MHCTQVNCMLSSRSLPLCTGSYDGEITVWNNSTENALRKLRPPQREPGVTGLGQSQGHASRATSEEGPESTDAVTRLYFLPGRGKGLGSTGDVIKFQLMSRHDITSVLCCCLLKKNSLLLFTIRFTLLYPIVFYSGPLLD